MKKLTSLLLVACFSVLSLLFVCTFSSSVVSASAANSKEQIFYTGHSLRYDWGFWIKTVIYDVSYGSSDNFYGHGSSIDTKEQSRMYIYKTNETTSNVSNNYSTKFFNSNYITIETYHQPTIGKENDVRSNNIFPILCKYYNRRWDSVAKIDGQYDLFVWNTGVDYNSPTYHKYNLSEGLYELSSSHNSGKNETQFGGIYKSMEVSSYPIVIDTTAPIGTLTGVTNGGFTNTNVSFSVANGQKSHDDDILTVQYRRATNHAKNNWTSWYSYSNALSQEGYYELNVSDKAGNSTTYTFTIDKTAPSDPNLLSMYKVNQGGYFSKTGAVNDSLKISWSTSFGGAGTSQAANSSDSFTFSGTKKYYNDSGTLVSHITSVSDGSTLTSDGLYSLALTDKAGNSKNYTFTIDKSPPTGILDGVTNGGQTKNNVTLSYKDDYRNLMPGEAAITATYKKDGGTAITVQPSGTTVSAEGRYVYTLTDSAGNSTSYTFIIDKTAPIGLIKANNVPISNNSYSKSNITFSWAIETGSYATYKKKTYSGSSIIETANTTFSNGTIFSDVGRYEISLYDSVGNVNNYSFTIDTTAPTGILSGVSNDGYTKNDVTLSYFNDYRNLMPEEAAITATYKKDGGAATTVTPSGITLSSEGTYTYTLTDKAGNSTTYTFTIDKTAPTFTFSQSFLNEKFTNKDISFKNNEGFGFTGSTGKSNLNDIITATLNGNAYTYDSIIRDEGSYTAILTDRAGNSSTFVFYIDKTKPQAIFTGIDYANFNTTNKNVSLTYSSLIAPGSTGKNSTEDMITITYRKDYGSQFTYAENSLLSSDGVYIFTLTDYAGNNSTYTFTIDKTPPTIKATTQEYLEIVKTRTNSNFYFTWSDTDIASATLSNGSSSSSYVKNSLITENGTYTLTLIDNAGNSTAKTIILDRSSPEFILLNRSQMALDPLVPYYNFDLRIYWDTTKYTVKLNNSSYDGSYLTIDGSYTFSIEDDIGNKQSFVFLIKKSLPDLNYKKLQSSIHQWYETMDKNGTLRSFVMYKTAEEYAYARENGTVTGGYWNGLSFPNNIPIYPLDIHLAVKNAYYFIYKEPATDNLVAFFSEASLISSLTAHAKKSVQVKTIPSLPAMPNDGENLYRSVYFSKDTVTFSKQEFTKLFIDGSERSYPFSLTNSGSYSIREIDYAGNQITYTVIIDKDRPLVESTDFLGNNSRIFEYNQTYYLPYGIKLWLTDIDTFCKLDINGVSYFNEIVNLKESGSYVITARDVAGNVGTLTINISLTIPSVIINEITIDDGETIDAFDIIINRDNQTTFTNIDISRLENGIWVILSSSNNVYQYNFNISGQYKITLKDNFERPTVETFYTFVRSAPKGHIIANGVEIDTGSYTRFSVNCNWKGTGITATLNGNPYIKDELITQEGFYTLVLTKASGSDTTISTYTFTIDKTLPDGKIFVVKASGAEESPNDTTTRFNTYFTWTEANCTATLNGEPYISGVVITVENLYTLILTDKAGNKRTYTFGIKNLLPVGKLYTLSGDLQADYPTNETIYFTWKEAKCTALLNGYPYTKDTPITFEGVYSVTLTDQFGNTNLYTFTIDKTKPIGQLYANGGMLPNNAKTRFDTYFSWDELNLTAYLGSSIYVKNSVFYLDGTYTISLIDLAGNKNSYTFTIDKTPPVGRIVSVNSSNPLESGSHTTFDVYFTWSESGCTVIINGQPYTKNTYITADNYYLIQMSDSVGNIVEYEFTIKKTKPIGMLTSNEIPILSGTITRYDVFFSWTEENCSATLNGLPYFSNESISNNGAYELILTDYLGNFTKYSFIIDKTEKLGTLVSNNNVLENNALTRFNVYFTWSEANCIATLNGEPYQKGSIISSDGNYTIVLTDKIGNSSEYHFEIDKTAPIGTIMADDNVLPNNASTRFNVSLTWNEKNITATLGGLPYLSGTLIESEGTFSVLLTDNAGNVTTYTFTIDKTPPDGVLFVNSQQLESNSITRFNVYFTWSEANCFATLNGKAYTKSNIISETGKHTIVLTDSLGNSKTYIFTIDKDIPIVQLLDSNDNNLQISNSMFLASDFYFTWSEEYTVVCNDQPYLKDTIISKDGRYIFIITKPSTGANVAYIIQLNKSAPTGSLIVNSSELANGGTTKSDVYFTWSEANCFATLNDKPYQKAEIITQPGTHIIILTNELGVTNSYFFTIDKSLPEVLLFDEFENMLTLQNGLHITTNFYFSWSDEITATINNFPYTKNTVVKTEGSYVFIFTKTTTGASIELIVTIDRTAPIGQFIDTTTKEPLQDKAISPHFVMFSWNENEDLYATINGEKYLNNTTLYVDGTYTIILTDKAGNFSEFTVTVLTSLPNGTIIGVPVNSLDELTEETITEELYNNAITHHSVLFAPSSGEYIVTVNGKEYDFSLITEAGTYEFIVFNQSGLSKKYMVTITVPNADSGSAFDEMFKGSKASDIVTIVLVSLAIGLFVIFPILYFKVFKKNPLKKKLSKK